jgi:hypothetical protein
VLQSIESTCFLNLFCRSKIKRILILFPMEKVATVVVVAAAADVAVVAVAAVAVLAAVGCRALLNLNVQLSVEDSDV